MPEGMPKPREMIAVDIGLETEEETPQAEWTNEKVAQTLGIEQPMETPAAHEAAISEVRENLAKHAESAPRKPKPETVTARKNPEAKNGSRESSKSSQETLAVRKSVEKIEHDSTRKNAIGVGVGLTAAATLAGIGAAFIGGDAAISALGLDSVASSLTSFFGEAGSASSDAIAATLAGLPLLGGLLATGAVWAGMKINHWSKERSK